MTKDWQSVSHPWVIPRMGEKCCKIRLLQCYLWSCNKTNNASRAIISHPISSPQEQSESLWHPKSHRSIKLLLDFCALLHESSRYVLLAHTNPEIQSRYVRGRNLRRSKNPKWDKKPLCTLKNYKIYWLLFMKDKSI